MSLLTALPMRISLTLALVCASVCVVPPPQTANAQANSAKELAGLWEAKKRFGPEVRGTLSIRQTGGIWQAEIAGRFAPVKVEADSVSFELTDGKASFAASSARGARRLSGIGHNRKVLRSLRLRHRSHSSNTGANGAET